MMKASPWAVLALLTTAAFAAEDDASIDRLLKKLPPPEKLVNRPAPATGNDPISRDPITQGVIVALQKKDLSRALSGSRQLARKYPKNASVHALHGIVAFSASQMAEASGAFRATIDTDSTLSLGYAGLGSSEAAQGHFASGLNAFQELTRRDPTAAAGWIGSSTCAQALGRREQSLQYARRATAVSPKSAAAWMQLARAENAIGHVSDARRALARARELGVVSQGTSSKRR